MRRSAIVVTVSRWGAAPRLGDPARIRYTRAQPKSAIAKLVTNMVASCASLFIIERQLGDTYVLGTLAKRRGRNISLAMSAPVRRKPTANRLRAPLTAALAQCFAQAPFWDFGHCWGDLPTNSVERFSFELQTRSCENESNAASVKYRDCCKKYSTSSL